MATGEEEWEGLDRVVAAATALESSLSSCDLVAGTAAADEIVTLSGPLLEQVREHPEHDSKRLAELASAVQVYRNAAFVFRRLAGVTGGADKSLADTCAAMVEQGNDHLRRFGGSPGGRQA